jgi:hypothetical protein
VKKRAYCFLGLGPSPGDWISSLSFKARSGVFLLELLALRAAPIAASSPPPSLKNPPSELKGEFGVLVSGLVNGETSPKREGDGDLLRLGDFPCEWEGMDVESFSSTTGKVRSPGLVATGERFKSRRRGSV